MSISNAENNILVMLDHSLIFKVTIADAVSIEM